jgi:hypothetical protein
VKEFLKNLFVGFFAVVFTLYGVWSLFWPLAYLIDSQAAPINQTLNPGYWIFAMPAWTVFLAFIGSCINNGDKDGTP